MMTLLILYVTIFRLKCYIWFAGQVAQLMIIKYIIIWSYGHNRLLFLIFCFTEDKPRSRHIINVFSILFQKRVEIIFKFSFFSHKVCMVSRSVKQKSTSSGLSTMLYAFWLLKGYTKFWTKTLSRIV